MAEKLIASGPIVTGSAPTNDASPTADISHAAEDIPEANGVLADKAVEEGVAEADGVQANSTAPPTICFGALESTFAQNITLEKIFNGFDCTKKEPDRTYFDFVAGQFGYIFPKATADVIRVFVLLKVGGITFPLLNQLLANFRVPANQVAPVNQIPLLPLNNGALQPINAGAGAAPIPVDRCTRAGKLLLQAAGFWVDKYLSDLLEAGLQSITDTVIEQIKEGSSQMSIISVTNSTRFPFTVTDSAAYKGDIVTTFKRLEPKDGVEEGSFAYIGFFSSDSTIVGGSASAITLTSEATTAMTNDTFIVAAAAPIFGKRTTLVAINDSAWTAYKLADKNDTKGEGKPLDGGDGHAFRVLAVVEDKAFKDYCHVRVILTEINPGEVVQT
ncbi:MAG: hypothetical protein M4579_002616 [Chaenotheca gracillima]|nr:MAG: hypothetical protein M4579_002616 [Chaenotheca gracillima]